MTFDWKPTGVSPAAPITDPADVVARLEAIAVELGATTYRVRHVTAEEIEAGMSDELRAELLAEYPDREPQGEFVVRLWFGEDQPVKQMIFSGNIGADGCAMAGQSLAMLRDAL